MTNHYLPTRADRLKPGDVVRWPWLPPDLKVTRVEAVADEPGTFFVGIEHPKDENYGFCVWGATMYDKRISDEEYEALSAPGVRDE